MLALRVFITVNTLAGLQRAPLSTFPRALVLPLPPPLLLPFSWLWKPSCFTGYFISLSNVSTFQIILWKCYLVGTLELCVCLRACVQVCVCVCAHIDVYYMHSFLQTSQCVLAYFSSTIFLGSLRCLGSHSPASPSWVWDFKFAPQHLSSCFTRLSIGLQVCTTVPSSVVISLCSKRISPDLKQ